jgi:pyruvate carboxylase
VLGIETNLGFLLDLAETPEFERGDYDTELVNRKPDLGRSELAADTRADLATALSALAAQSESEQRSLQNAQAGTGALSLSPWVMQDRARLR